ncbi:MAG: amino-acid N-acetyltransferase [Blastochloris sp.]|nr:amino-acid N-acetyltransferase [Blastochloris sp.]
MIPSELRGILTYTSKFRDQLFVLSVDSEVIADSNFRNLILDISVLRSLSINIIVVHGASQQMKELGQKMGIKPSNTNGMGVTDETTLSLALLAANRISHEFLEAFSETDLRAAVTNAIIAHPTGILGGQDQLMTGRVEKLDIAYLKSLLDLGVVPVLPPLGFDGEGRAYRVNSDGVALEVAQALKASKLMFVGTSNGVVNAGSLAAQFSISEAEDFIKKKRETTPVDVISKLEHGLTACRNGVHRSHIIDGRREEALLSEIFSNEGIGTMIYANEYEAVRKAKKKDVRAIMRLIKNSIQAEELVNRSEAEITQKIQDFFVFEIDKNIIGCVALHDMRPDLPAAEMACLYVSSGYENQGVGRKLMRFVEDRARELGMKQLFALSTRAFNYFQQKGGYLEGTSEMLTLTRREKYEQSGRNSKVLYKPL